MQYDVIIIGGSYSGLAAAMALGRALRKVLVIDNENPCNQQTPHSHNFLTNDGSIPKDIASRAKQQVQLYDTVHFLNGFATNGIRTANGFEIQVQTGETYTGRKLVLATGIKDIMPHIPGFAACWGISVLHCPYCHGYEVRQQKTGILANGDTAYEMASLIANWTNDLTLFTNGKSMLNEQQKIKLNQHHITIIEDDIQELIHNNGIIQHLQFTNGSTAVLQALYARLPFVQHCDLYKAFDCALTEEGYLKVDAAQRTTVDGIYACGDNASRIRTVANAVSSGTTTGIMVNKALIEEDF